MRQSIRIMFHFKSRSVGRLISKEKKKVKTNAICEWFVLRRIFFLKIFFIHLSLSYPIYLSAACPVMLLAFGDTFWHWVGSGLRAKNAFFRFFLVFFGFFFICGIWGIFSRIFASFANLSIIFSILFSRIFFLCEFRSASHLFLLFAIGKNFQALMSNC